jgi:hypothetical protein
VTIPVVVLGVGRLDFELVEALEPYPQRSDLTIDPAGKANQRRS